MMRIQCKRVKGWRKPAGAVYVGRPTKWGNPYAVKGGDRAAAVEKYREHLAANPDLVQQAKRELTGKALMCWCPLDQPCHADVLIEVANA